MSSFRQYNLLERYRKTGLTSDRPRIGRRRLTTPQEDYYLRTLHLRDRFLPAASSDESDYLTYHSPDNWWPLNIDDEDWRGAVLDLTGWFECERVVLSEGSKSSVCASLETDSAHAVVMANAQRQAVREVVPLEDGVLVCLVFMIRKPLVKTYARIHLKYVNTCFYDNTWHSAMICWSELKNSYM